MRSNPPNQTNRHGVTVSGVAWRGEIDDKRTKHREKDVLQTEREIFDGRREKSNYISQNIFGIDVRTVSYLRRYCSMLQNFDTFETPHKA